MLLNIYKNICFLVHMDKDSVTAMDMFVQFLKRCHFYYMHIIHTTKHTQVEWNIFNRKKCA